MHKFEGTHSEGGPHQRSASELSEIGDEEIAIVLGFAVPGRYPESTSIGSNAFDTRVAERNLRSAFTTSRNAVLVVTLKTGLQSPSKCVRSPEFDVSTGGVAIRGGIPFTTGTT